ncbi:uncharacterized protein [Magallana gigas]|uniref:uncharacterized protein isoform X2 n=1 Tax=Magallana gigas TaxID=29159 RepID=UPI003341DB1C
MKGFIFALAVSAFVTASKGQCPTNEGLGGTLSVVCGRQLGRNTASAINKNNLDVTMSTSDILSEELKCDHGIAESLLSLQIPLAIFVVISTVSTVLNIYLYVNIKSRNESKNDKTNPNVIMSDRGGNEPNVETYTELGNTETGEPENQYESITRQEKK